MSYSFQPDLPTETPDTWRVCDGFHPDIYGNYRTGWLPSGIGVVTGSAVKFGYGFNYFRAAGTSEFVLLYRNTTGATRNSYVGTTGGWADREGANSGSGTCFCQVGNITLVGGARGPLLGLVQRDCTTANNFAAVASSPASVGALAVNAQNIVMALDTTSDAYATSDTSAPTLWTGGESSSGNIRLTPGAFTAIVAMGIDFICFKERGVYRAVYQGGQVKWRFDLIDPEKGAWAPGCAVFGGGKVYFIGRNGAWAFDGASFERIDFGIWTTVLGLLGAAVALGRYYTETKLVWDSVTQSVFFFSLGQSGTITNGRVGLANAFFSYNVLSKKWGFQSRLSENLADDIHAVFDVAAENAYVTSVADPTSTGDRLYNTDVGFFSGANDKVEVLTTSFTAAALPGTNYKPTLRTNRFGRRDVMTYVERFIPNWTLADGVGTDLSTATVKTATHYFADSVMEGNTTDQTVTLVTDQYWADLRKSARWHNVELKINCEAVIDGGTWVVPKEAGKN